MRKVNLNDKIKVKLTKFGEEKYKEYFNISNNIYLQELDENGYLEIQIWLFMQIYGKCLYIGAIKLPTEDNSFYILEE